MRFRSFWPAILWTIVILVLSFTSGQSFPSADWMEWFKLDKWIHAFLYFSLFLLIYIPINERKSEKRASKILISILFCLFIGMFTELVQAYVLADRSGDIPDMVANTLGVVLGMVAVRIVDGNWPWKVANE